MIAGVVSYMLLCWEGGYVGLVSLTSSYPSPHSLYSLELRHMFIVVFSTEFISPYSLNTKRGWHTSEMHKEPSHAISSTPSASV